MAIIKLDQHNLNFYIQVNVDEEFKADEELIKLQQKSLIIKSKYQDLLKEVQGLLKDCTEWNKKNQPQKIEEEKEVEEKVG